MDATAYRSVGEELSDRIFALMEKQSSVAEITDPWALFKVDGFWCDDLNPSLFQATWALGNAKHRYQERHAETLRR